VHQVVTILDATGKRHASEVISYDKLSKATFLKGNVYDANGLLIKKLKNSEIVDQSSFEGLYSDNRYKAIDLAQAQYPYTVDIEYEIEEKYIFAIPSFYVLAGEKSAVEKGSCQLIYPKELEPRVKLTKIESKPAVAQLSNGIESKTWVFENIKPIKLEPMGPEYNAILPHIDIAPLFIEFSGYSGKMDTWDNFGIWINGLNKGRNVLPEATRAKIRSLTANAKTTEEKARVLYEYMQSKTRYISIQLGIGGYQPFEASVVDQTGYGDCKALSNYMVAMLGEVGVKANYVLIKAGEDASAMDTEFPRTQFNHAIAAIPNGTDTLWMECTSQTVPFGYQGKFTGNRKALWITDTGAKPVQTTRYPADRNVQSRTAEVYLDVKGDATAKIETTYAGLQYENARLHQYVNDQFDDQKKWIQNNTDIPSFDIVRFKMENHKTKIPSAVVTLDLSLKRFSNVSGKRMFVTPNLMNRYSYIPQKVEARKTSVVIETGFVDYDTIRYHLPENIYPEFVPESRKEASRFGEYESTFKLDQGELIYIRKLRLKEGTYPPESYNELIEFSKNINKADNIKMVFVNKT